MTDRVVALIDMDCFYCQVESRENPELRGKPSAVVQYNNYQGGGIIAVNYEARSFGVTRSERGASAKEKCPDIILVKGIRLLLLSLKEFDRPFLYLTRPKWQ